MSQPSSAVLSAALLSQDPAEQLSALKSLKNDIVGHDRNKKESIEAGILEPVVRILATSRSPVKPSLRDNQARRHSSSNALTAEEAVRLQALQVLASFANGGFAFLAPIHAAGALSVILSNIAPSENPPQVVTAALRAAVDIAETTALALPTSATDLANIAGVAFVPPLLNALREILAASFIQAQRNLVARLIALLCQDERHQTDLADAGILDALAINLASVIVARGFVIPGAQAIAQGEGVLDLIPEGAVPDTDVTAILGALAAVIGNSRWRAAALVNSPAILTVFPNRGSPGSSPRSQAVKASADALEAAGLSSVASKDLGIMDLLLPAVPDNQPKAISHFPPLGSSPEGKYQPSYRNPSNRLASSPLNWDPEAAEDLGPSPEGQVEEDESPLIPWLIYTARKANGLERIMTASVVTSLFKAGFANKSREAFMGRMVVPDLLQTLEDIGPTAGGTETAFTDVDIALDRSIVERGLAVLAKLMVDNDFLQKCAFEASGVKVISAALKGAYEPLSDKPSGSWSPIPPSEKPPEREIGLPTSRLGPRGQAPLLAHRIRVREVALKAVAALAGKDDHGKAFVDQDLVPYIVESLSAYPSKPVKDRPRSPRIFLGQDDGSKLDAAYGGNPITVIVAACHALRTLARSVSILRTTLQDSGIASPAFRLLNHPDIEVQIAASGLMCNLVTNVSPMRDRLDTVGVMRRLCDQTRSQNPVLRLNALWALKHWVGGASISQKKECLDELTPGLLVRLIREDTEDDRLYQRVDEDIEMSHAGEPSRNSMPAMLANPPVQPAQAEARTPRLRQAAERLRELREAELNPVRKVRDDDLAVQEQGLNFLRNLIGPVNSVTDSARDHADMIDHLFSVLDQDQFFEIMHSKLQLKVLHPFGRRYSGSVARSLYPQARIVAAVVYILVHLAASLPKHRQVLISQTKLLTDLGKHFNSKDKEVRVALCHLITNLTWRDDVEDDEGNAARARELKKLGLLGRLETLERVDSNLDVRERAKAAIWQINKPREF